MTRLDLIEMECTACKNVIFGDKNAEYWYCGICGKRIDIKASAELQEKENKLKAKEAELKIRENALRKKEAELKEKEEIIKALENGEELMKPQAPVTPTFKAAPVADGVVPTLVRPDTVLNNPEMKFTNLAADVNKKPESPVTTVPAKSSEPVQAEPEKTKKSETPKTNPESFKMDIIPEKKPELPEPENETPALQKKKPKLQNTTDDGKPKEFEMNEHTLIKYNTLNPKVVKVHLPANVWRIGSGAFKGNTNITSVVCSDNIKEICDSAFMDCTSLTEITLSNEIRKINFKTFNGCDKLKSITIPESVTEIMCDSMVCGLEEIVLKNARTTWEQASDAADASFAIDKNGNGKGVSRIVFKGVEYKALDVFKHGCLSNYFKANGLCQYCGSKFSFVNGKCPNCKTKKDY
ncbi:MAG: leucine-rich repeat protein [Prevotella sp.]|nr:leucine-rich repeat protein [Alistipes senegalensis]MCM1357844.1 leucine-rich repeat protein [Prevotella sp.]MCM1473527.1 leucine-rich repeat protein [Muribaculaceae bacterium]